MGSFPYPFNSVPSDLTQAASWLQSNFQDAASRRMSPESLLTTRGDLIRRGASAPERVALGASGSFLMSNGTDAVWGQVPIARAYANGNQAIPENAWTKVTGLTKHFQSETGMVDTTNSKVVVPRTGMYRVNTGIRMVAPGVNVQLVAHRAYIAATATELTQVGFSRLAGIATGLAPFGSSIWPLNAGTAIELDIYWYAGVGGTYSTVGGAHAVFIELEWLGPTTTA